MEKPQLHFEVTHTLQITNCKAAGIEQKLVNFLVLKNVDTHSLRNCFVWLVGLIWLFPNLRRTLSIVKNSIQEYTPCMTTTSPDMTDCVNFRNFCIAKHSKCLNPHLCGGYLLKLVRQKVFSSYDAIFISLEGENPPKQLGCFILWQPLYCYWSLLW